MMAYIWNPLLTSSSGWQFVRCNIRLNIFYLISFTLVNIFNPTFKIVVTAIQMSTKPHSFVISQFLIFLLTLWIYFVTLKLIDHVNSFKGSKRKGNQICLNSTHTLAKVNSTWLHWNLFSIKTFPLTVAWPLKAK